MRKKTVSIVMAAIFAAASLCGCGETAPQETSETVSEAPAAEEAEAEETSETEAEPVAEEIPEADESGKEAEAVEGKYAGIGDIEGLMTPGKLTFVCDDTQAPLGYRDADTNELIGFDIDCGNAIAEYLGLEPAWECTTFDGLIMGVNAGKFDAALAGIYVTEKRGEQVDFATTYYTMDEVICVPAGTEGIETADDLAGHITGVQAGSVAADDVRAVEGVGDTDVKEYKYVTDGLMDLKTGRLDAFVTESLMAAYYGEGMDVKYDAPLESIKTAICIDKSHPEITEAVDEAIAALVADGTFSELSEKWFGRDIIVK